MLKEQELNELLKSAEIGNFSFNTQLPYQIYGLGPNSLIFINDAARQHKEILKKGYLTSKNIMNRFTFATYSDYVIKIVRDKKVSDEVFTDQDAKDIDKHFNDISDNKIQIWKEIYGIEMKNEAHVKLGEFSIIDWEKEKNTIEIIAKQRPEVLWMNSKYEYLIGLEISTGEINKAYEIAEEKFSLFENIIHIVMGSIDDSILITIFYPDNSLTGSTIAYSTELGSGGKFPGWKRHITPVQIDDSFFNNEEFKAIFALITKKNTNDLEQRILISSNWLGQAFRETNYTDGYLKAIIALEILFSANKEGIITPSITYQISESCALILGNNPENCIEIENDIKELYSKRSAIVHNGKNSIEKKDFAKACEYARAIIFKLLENTIYKVSSLKELYKELKTIKYSASKK